MAHAHDSLKEYSLYICDNCKQSFYYVQTPKKKPTKMCRNCLQPMLHERHENVIFACPFCKRQYDGSVLLVDSHLSRKKFQIFLGKLLCPRDNTPLELHSLKEEISKLTDNLMEQVGDGQAEIQDEADFLAKVNRLKEEVMNEIELKSTTQTATAQRIKADRDTRVYSKITISSTAAQEAEGIIPYMIPPEKMINPIDYTLIIPTPPPFTPYANEFWEFYYENREFSNPKHYPGGNRCVQKIQRFLEEFAKYIINSSKIDIRYPIYEKVKNGTAIYIGDTHGSVDDTDKLIRYCVEQIEEAIAVNEDIRIVFVGDYVDRNDFDIHNVLYIFAFALKYPKYVRLLRGNHEEVTINMRYGFWDNLNTQLPNSYLFNDFEYIFMKLPLIHVLEVDKRRIMCLHGGIPFFDMGYEEMPEMPRFMEGLDPLDSHHATIDDMDILSQQILWSDPVIALPPRKYFLPNPRGIGFSFGKKVFEEFCQVNAIDRVVRGHEVFLAGHRELFDDRLFSLFSNSNYVGKLINARILEFKFDMPWEKNWEVKSIQQDL